jgi:hypothetical protein
MPFTFYHSPFCPRCARAEKHLQNLLGKPLPDTIVFIDVVKHPIQTWQDGIRMIPAIKAGEDVISGITLSTNRIKTFLDRHELNTSQNQER